MRTVSGERWSRHQAALLPVANPVLPVPMALQRLMGSHDGELEAVVDFLRQQGLAGVWANHCAASDCTASGRDIVATLDQIWRGTLLLQAAQERVMTKVAAAFDAAGIVFVFLKTAGTRRELYPTAGLRPSTDVDLLVGSHQRDPAQSVLESLGGRPWPQQGHSEHEAAFRLDSVDIDLHWDLLAPGRLRGDVAAGILSRRVPAHIGWRPDDTDVLFVQLVHLAFAKHVCSPHAGLNRVSDVLLTLRKLHPEMDTLQQRVYDAGCASAAWASACWIAMLASRQADVAEDGTYPTCVGRSEVTRLVSFMNQLAPSAVRAAYLRHWLRNDWPGRMSGRHEWLVRIAFTLALHDSFADVLRASYRKLVRRNLPAAHSVA